MTIDRPGDGDPCERCGATVEPPDDLVPVVKGATGETVEWCRYCLRMLGYEVPV